MFEYEFRGVRVLSNEELDENAISAYLAFCEERMKPGQDIYEMTLDFDGEFVTPSVRFHQPNFNRIRRITGYLTGSLDTWNNAKKAEEHDRVKHGIVPAAKQTPNG